MAGNSVFYKEKHVEYIRKVSMDTESFEYLATQHFRMSGIYWGLTSLYLLGVDIKQESSYSGMVDWILSCQDQSSGGFGGNIDHDPHLLYTLSAVQILALYDELAVLDVDKICSFVAELQQADGSFAGDKWGEIDTRFSYCALSILSILGRLDSGVVNVGKAIEYVGRCKNFDGGFGAVPGAESHAGQIFCCVGALSIGSGVELVDEDLLGWWLSERQCDSGGLNGRPEKQADVCYSWWILSSLAVLGRIPWIDRDGLIDFIIKCQDSDDGGIADRPGNMADIFHSFFGISGLLLLEYFEDKENPEYSNFKSINPTYALPEDVVQRLGLKSQKLHLEVKKAET